MSPLAHPRQAGFTFTELLITVAIVGIVSIIALPSFTDLIVRNRLSAQANELVAAVSLARTSAIETNAGGGVCPANAGQTGCGGSWANGWVVWADSNGNGNADPDEVLSVGGISDKDLLAGMAELRFDSRGRREVPAPGAGNVSLQMSPVSCSSGNEHRRIVTITPVGSVSVSKGLCS